jgi:hypothetical protein
LTCFKYLFKLWHCIITISRNNSFRHDIAEMVLNNNKSLTHMIIYSLKLSKQGRCVGHWFLFMILSKINNCIRGVMVRCAHLECPDQVKPKTIKMVFVASSLSTQHKRDRAKTGWPGIRKMCLSGATCLTVDCCFSELAL